MLRQCSGREYTCGSTGEGRGGGCEALSMLEMPEGIWPPPPPPSAPPRPSLSPPRPRDPKKASEVCDVSMYPPPELLPCWLGGGPPPLPWPPPSSAFVHSRSRMEASTGGRDCGEIVLGERDLRVVRSYGRAWSSW